MVFVLQMVLKYFVGPIISIIVGRGVLEALHYWGWYPDQWVTEMLTATPAAFQTEATWIFSAGIASLLLFLWHFFGIGQRIHRIIGAEKPIVPSTHFHGGTHYHLPDGITPETVAILRAPVGPSQQSAPARLEHPQQVIAFDAEADGNQPSLPVDEWQAIKFSREHFDIDDSFSNDTFFAESKGFYEFDLTIGFSAWDKAAVSYEFRLNTSNRFFREVFSPKELSANLPVRAKILTEMDAGDTAVYEVRQIGGNSCTNISGGSFFRGRLIRKGDDGLSLAVDIAQAAETGTFTPSFTFSNMGDLEVTVHEVDATYWKLEKFWKAEATFTITPRYSTSSGKALVSLPFVSTSGPSEILIQCESDDALTSKSTLASILPEASSQLIIDIMPADLRSGHTYRFSFVVSHRVQ